MMDHRPIQSLARSVCVMAIVFPILFAITYVVLHILALIWPYLLGSLALGVVYFVVAAWATN